MSARFEVPTDRLGTDDFNDVLRQTAKELAAAHAALEPLPAPAAISLAPWSPGAWRARWRKAQAACATPAEADVEHMRQVMWLSESYIHHRDALFLARHRDGWVREGVGDVLADVASVAADVEALAGPRAAQRVLGWYHEFSNEQHPASLAHFFVAYHALTRGRIAMAHQHLEQAKPRLVLVGGGPGTGKSTLAGSVAEVVGWPVLSASETVEPDVLVHAEQLLHMGEAVIIDGPWVTDAERGRARQVAASAGAEVVEIQCSLSPSIARERLAWQMASIWDPADETPDVVDDVAARFEPWPEAVQLDTGLPLLRCRSDALKAVLGFPITVPPGSEDAHALMDENDIEHSGDHVGDRHVLR